MPKTTDPKYLARDGLKVCRKCEQQLPVSVFTARAGAPDGLRNDCTPCRSAHGRIKKGRPTPGEVVSRDCRICGVSFDQVATGSRLGWICPDCRRERQLEAMRVTMRRKNIEKYGVTLDQFNSMLSAQGGKCAICDATEPGGQGRWVIDHDHACCPGKGSCGECVRGLLCNACNVGLGMFKDDPDLIRVGAEYLERR